GAPSHRRQGRGGGAARAVPRRPGAGTQGGGVRDRRGSSRDSRSPVRNREYAYEVALGALEAFVVGRRVGHAQPWGGARPRMRLDDDFHVLAERHEESQETLHRKLAEIATQHLRNVGLLYLEKLRRLYLLQAARLHQAVDIVNELGFDEVLPRIRQA